MGDDGFHTELHVLFDPPSGHGDTHGPAAEPDAPPLRPATLAALDALVRLAASDGIEVVLEHPARHDGTWPAGWSLPSAWVRTPDGSGTGVSADEDVAEESESAADEAVRVADTAHEAVVEAMPALGRPTNWPPCPDHPDSHPLQLGAGDDADPRPRWTCPRSHRVTGHLGERSRGR